MRRHGNRQTLVRSTSTVSTSNLQTPLTSNIFTNDNRYAVDSHDFFPHCSNVTYLGGKQPSPSASNPPTNANASYESVGEEESVPTDGDASSESVGEEESVPGQINTSQGANGDSPGGLTRGTGVLYHTAQSTNISIVSEIPQNPPVGLDPFLVQKTKHRNDMLDVLLIISSPEGRHLKVCPIRQLHLDLLGVPLLVRINRRDVRDWRSIDHISPLTFIVLQHCLGSFDIIPTHYCFQQSRSPQNKMLKAAPRWRLDNPA